MSLRSAAIGIILNTNCATSFSVFAMSSRNASGCPASILETKMRSASVTSAALVFTFDETGRIRRGYIFLNILPAS